ncbi:MAG: glutamate racemase [Alphaproteobacteria bacterium]|nr:glutamate racemase [Alphaproteobacteria bacterium]
MKIGVFDSGLGGLIITKSFVKRLGKYDYLYLGDTKNLPYGEKSAREVLDYTIEAIKFLIKNDCKLIIIACNTASSIALRYLQRVFIPDYAPEVKVLGVVVPTVEEAIACSSKTIGVIATNSTIQSHIYEVEIKKINPTVDVKELATPEFVPAIESNDFALAETYAKQYAREMTEVDSLILGCTHYPLLKKFFEKELPNVHLISQADFMGEKLAKYLNRHPEIESVLSKAGKREFVVTKLNQHYSEVAKKLFEEISIKEINFL